MTRRRVSAQGGWALPAQHPGATHTLLSPAGDGIDQAVGTVRRTVLPGGLRVITEQLPTVRSVSLLSLIHISEPTRQLMSSRMPSSA